MFVDSYLTEICYAHKNSSALDFDDDVASEWLPFIEAVIALCVTKLNRNIGLILAECVCWQNADVGSF